MQESETLSIKCPPKHNACFYDFGKSFFLPKMESHATEHIVCMYATCPTCFQRYNQLFEKLEIVKTGQGSLEPMEIHSIQAALAIFLSPGRSREERIAIGLIKPDGVPLSSFVYPHELAKFEKGIPFLQK